MDFYAKYTSPLGYQTGENDIDRYGVDHSGFTTRDEVEYQLARQEKENQLIKNDNTQGITQNDPQYGTYFGGKPDNNDGFRFSNIHDNIENMKQETELFYDLERDNKNQKISYNNPNCYITFDGKHLNLFSNNQKVNSLDAMSGQSKYQAKKFQNVPNKGPIPEGTYYANQDQRQTISTWDTLVGAITGLLGINRGKWKGSLPAWGMRRIWLKPDSNTYTYERDGFTIHGGLIKGSAGCIDIPWQTNKLSDYMDKCQESVPVYVSYPNDNW